MASVGSTFTVPANLRPLGTFQYLTAEQASQPGVDSVSFVNLTVPAGKTRNIYKVSLDSGVQCRCKIYHGINLIGSFRNGTAKPSGEYFFDLPYAVPAGEVLSVTVDFSDGFPVVNVACYVQMTET